MASEELPDYSECENLENDEVVINSSEEPHEKGLTATATGLHILGFRDLLLRPGLLHALVHCGLQQPTEVQRACLPWALVGHDVLCEAGPGLGKTVACVLACLQRLEGSERHPSALVLCPTTESAQLLQLELSRLTLHLPGVRIGAAYGTGPPADLNGHVLVGTPSRVAALLTTKTIQFDTVSQLALDDCDVCLGSLDVRRDVQRIAATLPARRQVLAFGAALPPSARAVCKRLMQTPREVYMFNEEPKLSLHGLAQFCLHVREDGEKEGRLCDLLDTLEIELVVIFVSSPQRAVYVAKQLEDSSFPCTFVHTGLSLEDRCFRVGQFESFQKRILVSTDLDACDPRVNLERVTTIINYDMPRDSHTYLRRVGCACRHGTKRMAITLTCGEADAAVLQEVQERFNVHIDTMPSNIYTELNM